MQYSSYSECLLFNKISYGLLVQRDSIKVKIRAPLYMRKEWIMSVEYGLSYPLDKIHLEVESRLTDHYKLSMKLGD